MDKHIQLVHFGVDAYRKGAVLNFNSQQTDDIIRKAFVDLMGTDNPTKRQLRRQLRRNEVGVFEIIEEVLAQLVDDTWENNVFFKQFVEYRNLDHGDTNEFYVEDRTMLTVSEIADGHWNLRRQKLDIGSSFPVPMRTYGASVYTDFLRFISGRINWTQLINKVYEAMRRKMATEIYLNFMGSMQYLPPEFQGTGSFSEDAIMEIVDQVSISNNYADVIIAGTSRALREFKNSYSGLNTFLVSENMKNELNKTGIIDYWNGIRLLEIPQVHVPNTFDFMLNDKRLMILSGNEKPIKIVHEGDPMIRRTDNGVNNEDQSMDFTYITKFGIACIFNQYYGMYELE